MTPSEKADAYADNKFKLGISCRQLVADAYLAGYAARHAEESKDASLREIIAGPKPSENLKVDQRSLT